MSFLVIPHWVARTLMGIGITADLFIIGSGITGLIQTPPSLEAAGFSNLETAVWSSLLIVGGTVAIAAVPIQRLMWHWLGCALSGAGLLVWAGFIVLRDSATLTSIGIAMFLTSTAMLQLWRALAAQAGLGLVERDRR